MGNDESVICDGPLTLQAELCALAWAAWAMVLRLCSGAEGLSESADLLARERAEELAGAAAMLWEWAERISEDLGGPSALPGAPWERMKVPAPGESDPARAVTNSASEVRDGNG